MTINTKKLQEELNSQRREIIVERYDLTVRELVRMGTTEVGDGEMELNITPAYQRKFRWSESDESKLIESIYLELPVPPLFMAANLDGTWEVVDGLQRVSTLIHFLKEGEKDLSVVRKKEPLELRNLSRLPSFEGNTFRELPKPFQLQFEKRKLRVTLLQDTSDRGVRYELFERLNKQGITLTPQEVRACVHIEFMKEINNISEIDSYNSIIDLAKNNQDDGTKEELVLKFIAYKNNIDNYDGSVKNFLNEFVEEESDYVDLGEERKIFKKATEEIEKVVPSHICRGNSTKTPINLADGILVAAGILIEEGEFPFEPKSNWQNDSILYENSTNGTNNPTKLKGRIKRAKELLQGDDVK